MSISNFKCKQEEAIPIMELAWQSIMRDKAEFTAFSPVYSELFFTTQDKALKDLNLLVRPKVMEAESKELTKEVITKMEAFRPRLNSLESYVNKAAGEITAATSDFGFSTIRENISAHNKEGVVENMEILLQLVVRNQEALRLKGFLEAAQKELETATKELAATNLQKGTQILDTAKLVKKYNKEIKTLFEQISEVCKDGKIIFAKKAPEKVKDYTFTELLKLVRMAKPKKDTPPSPTPGQ